MFINRYAWFGVIALNSALSWYALRPDGRVCLVLSAALSWLKSIDSSEVSLKVAVFRNKNDARPPPRMRIYRCLIEMAESRTHDARRFFDEIIHTYHYPITSVQCSSSDQSHCKCPFSVVGC